MIFRDLPFAPELVSLPDGYFLMGTTEGEMIGLSTERPQHRVTIAPVAVGRYPVTFAEWDACLAAGGSTYRPPDNWGRGRQPVVHVNWHDAQAFARWLSEASGKRYRLLSEAEWEYAARAGTTTPYSSGQSIDGTQACFAHAGGALPVGSFPANAFGLCDMHGNVWEWTQDCWNPAYEGAPDDGSAWLSGDCGQRVARGGSWSGEVSYVRSAFRFNGQTGLRSNALGFRVARELD